MALELRSVPTGKGIAAVKIEQVRTLRGVSGAIVMATIVLSACGCAGMVDSTANETEAVDSVASAVVTVGPATLIAPEDNAVLWVGDLLNLEGTCNVRMSYAGPPPIPVWSVTNEPSERLVTTSYGVKIPHSDMEVVTNNHIRVPLPPVGRYVIAQACPTSGTEFPKVHVTVNDAKATIWSVSQATQARQDGSAFVESEPIVFSGSCTELPTVNEEQSRYQPRWSVHKTGKSNWTQFSKLLTERNYALPAGHYEAKLECIDTQTDSRVAATAIRAFEVGASAPDAAATKQGRKKPSKKANCTVM